MIVYLFFIKISDALFLQIKNKKSHKVFMNPCKIELPENLIKKLETETNIFNNINGLIQGKNLIIEENKEINNKSMTSSSNGKKSHMINNNDNINNFSMIEENYHKNSEDDILKQSIFNFLRFSLKKIDLK